MSSAAAYTYNLENRLASASIARAENGQAVEIQSRYVYNHKGIRVRANSTGTDPNTRQRLFDKSRSFLIDEANHTGYAQVLEEHDAAGLKRSYTIGDDVLGQATLQSSEFGVQRSAFSWLLCDGHGSTRALADSAGNLTDRYSFDAYGIMLGGQPAAATQPAATDLLYVGELFDADLQWNYHRARYYDMTAGRWNRLDPFPGDHSEPASLHKYAYCHADPVNGLDPTGEWDIGALNTIGSIAAQVGATSVAAAGSMWRGVRSSVGFPISVITGDAFGENEKIHYSQTPNPAGRALVTINGIWNTKQSSREMNAMVAKRMGFSSAIRVHNPTFLCIGDLIQVAANELLAIIDQASVRASNALTGAHSEAAASASAVAAAIVDVVAHSQGTMIFRRAIELLPGNVKAGIRYQGFGGEAYICHRKHGLATAHNVRNAGDLIPCWAKLRSLTLTDEGKWDKVHNKVRLLNRHAFVNYIEEVRIY